MKLSEADLLFLDTPVGAGYSYVTNSQALCTTSEENAADIQVFFKKWLAVNTGYHVRTQTETDRVLIQLLDNYRKTL